MVDGIGGRVADSMPEGLKQVELAARVGMTPDALSRSLSGSRGFSSLEIAKIADELSADLHWLITGEPDPTRILVAARHSFDASTRSRSVPGWPSDSEILEDVGLVYRQAEPALKPASSTVLPTSSNELRERLGPAFVRSLADGLESDLGIDVVRVSGLTTAYSFTVSDRRVIALPQSGNWFWENWSMAHEYCHLSRNHLEAEYADEPEANGFAADLLLPEDVIRGRDWESINAVQVAELIWEWGVSTDALSRRLHALSVGRSSEVDEWLGLSTQALLRRYWSQPDSERGDAITLRMDAAASRRFPLALQEAHLELIAEGKLAKDSLAWMLGVDPGDLEVELPAPPEVSDEELLDALGFGRQVD